MCSSHCYHVVVGCSIGDNCLTSLHVVLMMNFFLLLGKFLYWWISLNKY